jgi:hypothetical protein
MLRQSPLSSTYHSAANSPAGGMVRARAQASETMKARASPIRIEDKMILNLAKDGHDRGAS